MSIKIGLLSIYCLFLSLSTLGQATKWQLQFNQISSDKGLSELTNHFVFKDSKGYVWISSIEGLNRYDGRRVKVYKSNPLDSFSLIDDNIQSPFFEDDKGDIWFATVNGINCYRRKRDNFDKFTIKKENIVSSYVGYNALFLEQNQWLWVQAEGKLFKFNIKNKEQQSSKFLADLDAVRFSIDTFSSGKVRRIIACYWMGKEGIDVLEFDEQDRLVKKQAYFDKNDVQLPPLLIQQALVESDTVIWLSGGAFLVKLNLQKRINFKLFSPKPYGTDIRNIISVNSSELVVSTNKTPLLFFNTKSERFTTNFMTYSENSKYLSNAAQLYLDKSKVLWTSTFQKGLFYAAFKSQQFTQPFAKIQYPNLSVNQIKEDKNRKIWISYLSHQSGYYILQDRNISAQHLSSKNIQFLQKSNGQFWGISRNGAFNVYDFGNKNFSQKATSPTLDIIKVEEINDSTLLIGTTIGFFYFDTKNFLLSKDTNNGVSLVFKKVGDRHIWHDTPEGNIICQIIKGNRLGEKIKETISYSDVNGIYISSNTPSVVWAATALGIVKININTLKDTLLTEKDGLPSNYIQSVLEDKNGNLWCGTNQGIFKYNPHTKKSKLYTKRHGLSSDSYNRDAALLSSTGVMWFGGNNGVDVFFPDSIRDIGHAPQSAIVGLKIFDKPWKGDTAIEVVEHITLKHNENTLTLDLAAMEYTDPENNLFKVALVAKGDTIQWTDLGTQNHITYPNLREGTYTFMLLTANCEGIWNETPKTLVLDILPPYWRTWWFLTLIALATIALVAYIVYLRLSKVIALQKIRLNLYENLHDDIGSRLTAIVLSVDMLMQKTAIKDEKLGQISTISRNIVANMRRLVWATAPENDALSTVAQQMQTDKRVLLPTSVAFHLTMDKTLGNLNIGGDKRYQMLSIFNEALTNIAKYAEATEVKTSLEIVAQNLIMTIVDNGKGYDPIEKREDTSMSSGHGLRNMQRRAYRIKGQIDIASKLGKGTTVKLTFPIHDETIWTKFKGLFSKYPQNWG